LEGDGSLYLNETLQRIQPKMGILNTVKIRNGLGMMIIWLFYLNCSIIMTTTLASPNSEKSLPDLFELVQQLRGAIVARDVAGVKMYLAELEGLGRSSQLASSSSANTPLKPCANIAEESSTSSASSSTGHKSKKRSKREETQCQTDILKCKSELEKSNSLVESSRRHQSQEVEKLKQVRRGVEQLLESLRGAQNNLNEIKKESSERKEELSTLHAQAAAAAQLEQDISEIQERARVNYETGLVELEGGRQLMSAISDEVMNKHKIALPVDAAIMHADPKLLLDVVVLLGAAAAGGTLASAVNMPHIIGYLLGGAFVGPSGWGLVKAVVQVETLAQFGGVFFLFGHGLEFSLKEQRKFQTVSVGGALLSTALIAVTVQISTLLGGIVSGPLEGALLGMSVSLSSLSVVLDYLRAHNLLQSTPAKVMVGMLGVQGFLVGLFFSVPPALSDESPDSAGAVRRQNAPETEEKQPYEIMFALATSLIYAVFTSLIASAATRHVLPRVFASHFFSADQELYLLGVVSIAMFMALMTESFGLSLDLGAFFAGLMLSELDDGSHRTKNVIQPLSSVFGAMLFASLGMMLNAEFFWRNLTEIIIIALQLVAVKTVIVWSVVRLFDFSFRTSIFCAVGLSHVGELSLLFSSKLQAYNLLSRRAYLLFLAATFATLAFAPLVLKILAKSRLASIDKQQRTFSLDGGGGGGDSPHDTAFVESIPQHRKERGFGMTQDEEDSGHVSSMQDPDLHLGTWRRRL
jgi:Kef-type K+ transport system membrane component KefB